MKIMGKVRLPVEIAGMRSSHDFYVTPNFWEMRSRGRIGYNKVHIEFNPAVNAVRILLVGTPEDSVVVVTNEDIKLPPRTAVSSRGRLMTKEGIKEGVFQIVPVNRYSPEEDEVALCETVVGAAEVVPIMLANQAKKSG